MGSQALGHTARGKSYRAPVAKTLFIYKKCKMNILEVRHVELPRTKRKYKATS